MDPPLVGDCCGRHGYDDVFGARFSRRLARRPFEDPRVNQLMSRSTSRRVSLDLAA